MRPSNFSQFIFRSIATILALFPVLVWGQTVTQTFNASGSWTVPCGVTSVTVQAWGGGGGGAGESTDNGASNAFGGGGGGFVTATIAVTPGSSIAYTVGAGGTSGTGNGGNGGSTVFSTITANGGTGGTNAAAGVGGSGSGGTVTSGSNGQSPSGTTGGNGGNGGNSAGSGGIGGADGVNGANGNVPGGGGGGAGDRTGGAESGGTGGSGRIIITYTGPYAGPDQILAACATSTTLAANSPSGAGSTGAWTASPSAGVTFSPNANAPNATVNGLVPGTNYTLTWSWSGGGAGCTSTNDQVQINTTPGPGCWVYCTNDFPSGVYSISNVTFGSINNTSAVITGGLTPDAENFSGMTTSATVGSTLPISVTANGAAGNSFCVMAFFDWNNDGDYSDAGESYNLGTYTSASATLTGNITIPAGATLGSTSFRIIQHFSTCASPCEVAGYGQSETYSINIVGCNMTTPNAGTDQTLASCFSSATFAGNAIANGIGTWVLVSGSGTITTPSSPTSTVTNLGPGANEFMWVATPTDPNCQSLFDNVVINTTNLPTVANAGADIETCNSSIALAGNTPTVGTGLWTIVAGPGSISAPASNPTATISGLVLGSPTTLQWTITSVAGCTSSDQVVVSMVAGVTAANAGPDQTGLCTGGAINLAGNNPANGVGTWTGAGGIIVNPSSPTSAINALNTAGTYTYTWTVTAPGCPSSSDAVNVTVAFCDPNMNTVTCGTPVTFTDGAGTQYANNSLIVEKFCPSTPGQYVTATFTEVAFFNLLDHMVVLNGSSYSAPIIDDFYSIPTINGGTGTITSSAADGCLTFIFLSSPSDVGNGWTASISCTAAPSTTNTVNCDWTNCLGGCLRTVCGVPTNVPFTGAGVGAEELNNVNGGCLAGGERCSNWFLINPTSAGTLTMNMFVNAGQDQDFAVWEAYDPLLECPSMTGDAPIMCNFAGSTAQGTGFNSTVQALPNAAYEPTLNISAAQISAGVYYIVLVNTYNNGGACPQPTVSITFGGTAGLSCSPPIVLGDEDIILNGFNDGTRNYLSWQVENELNVDHYALERSKNGTDWTVVGLRGSHKSSSGSEYYMYDEMPYSPFTYYRVKQTNTNGEEKTSDIITISSGELGEFWVSELFPNPTADEVSFQYQANNFEDAVEVEVYNSIGQLVISGVYEVGNLSGITIPTQKLAIGTYQVKISQGDRETIKKLSIIR